MLDFTNLFQIRSDLTESIERNDLKHLKELLELKQILNVNYLDKEGQTPLHRSCSLGKLDFVELLCDYGASQSIKNKEGWFPIHLAAYYGHMNIFFFLLKQSKQNDLIVFDKQQEYEQQEEEEENSSLESSFREETDDEQEEEEEETNNLLLLNFTNLKL